jgi:hypothetical protein
VVASSQKAEQEAATGPSSHLRAQQTVTPVGISSAHMAAQQAVTAGQPSSQLHDWSIQGLL